MVEITLRRVFRSLYCLVAVGTLAALPVLIIDFKNHDWSVHYKVMWHARAQPKVAAIAAAAVCLQQQQSPPGVRRQVGSARPG